MSLRFYPPYTRIPSLVASEIQQSFRTFPLPITMVNAQNAGVVTLKSMLDQRFSVVTDSDSRLVSLDGIAPHGGFTFFVQGIRFPSTTAINTVYVQPGSIVEVLGAK